MTGDDATSKSRTFRGEEIEHDPHEGYYLEECPKCGQDWSMVFLGSICADYGTKFELTEVEVSWDE